MSCWRKAGWSIFFKPCLEVQAESFACWLGFSGLVEVAQAEQSWRLPCCLIWAPGLEAEVVGREKPGMAVKQAAPCLLLPPASVISD